MNRSTVYKTILPKLIPEVVTDILPEGTDDIEGNDGNETLPNLNDYIEGNDGTDIIPKIEVIKFFIRKVILI